MALEWVLGSAMVVCMAALASVIYKIRKINGIQSAADRLTDFRNFVDSTRRRVTSIHRVAAAQGSTDSGGVFALYDLHTAIEFADQVIQTAETLIDAKTPVSLRAACELFDEDEAGEMPLSPKQGWEHGFSAPAWKRQVTHLVERAERSILGESNGTRAVG